MELLLSTTLVYFSVYTLRSFNDTINHITKGAICLMPDANNYFGQKHDKVTTFR